MIHLGLLLVVQIFVSFAEKDFTELLMSCAFSGGNVSLTLLRFY